MPESAITHFNCPNCDARYKVVRVEASSGSADQEISCLSCHAPIASYDGKMALKYFQIERAPRHRRVLRSA